MQHTLWPCVGLTINRIHRLNRYKRNENPLTFHVFFFTVPSFICRFSDSRVRFSILINSPVFPISMHNMLSGRRHIVYNVKVIKFYLTEILKTLFFYIQRKSEYFLENWTTRITLIHFPLLLYIIHACANKFIINNKILVSCVTKIMSK